MKTHHLRVAVTVVLALAAVGWCSNFLAAPACRDAVLSHLRASLEAHRSNFQKGFEDRSIQWIEPSMLEPDPFDLKQRACFPFTCYKPTEAAAARIPYAWVKAGSLYVPFLVPVYSARLIGGQAGDGQVTLFFSPLGSRAPITRRTLWLN